MPLDVHPQDRFDDVLGAGRRGGPGAERTVPRTDRDDAGAFTVRFLDGRTLAFAALDGYGAGWLTWVTKNGGGEVLHEATLNMWQADPAGCLAALAAGLCPTVGNKARAFDDGDGYGPQVQSISAHTELVVRFPAPGQACDYVRVCKRDGTELAYWTLDEVAQDPADVLGALVGALNPGA